MTKINRALYGVVAFIAVTVQSVVTAFGGGNGDPAVLSERRQSTSRGRTNKRRD